MQKFAKRSLSLSLLLASFQLAWGEEPTKPVFYCNKDNCLTNKGESKIFEISIFFCNVVKDNFTNNGTMTFKNLVYFANNNQGTDFKNGATFENNGIMKFESSAVFQKIINNNTLNFNADTDYDDLYVAVSGNIHNSGIINANGQIKFTAAKADEGFNWYRIINYSGGTFNVNGKTQIEQAVWNMGKFYIYNETAFREAFYNYTYTGLFIIESPTTFTYWLRNERGATLIIKSPTVINRYLDNFLSAITKIKGTTLTATNGVWNYEGGIFIFSALNGQMGQLVGNFTNKDNQGQNEGKVIVNVRGLSAGTKYQIINGTTILLDGKDIEFINGTGRYEGDGWIWIDEVFAPKIFLTLNQQVIKKVLESKLVSMNDSDISQAILNTETMLKTNLITQPTNMLKAFKADTLTSPLNSAYVARLTASSASIMSDASSFANPLEKASQTQFFATPFGGVLKGDDLSGHLLGLSVGLTHIADDYIAQGHFAYANGKSTQDLQAQSTQINGNLFEVGGFGRLFYDKLETDINANFIFAKFSLDNAWLDNALNSSSNFNNYQINLGAVAGWRFGDDLSVKPFASLQTYYENQGEFKQSALNLTSEAYSSFVMDALVGVEGRYIFENGGFAFAKASYENKLYNSHKEVFMRVGTDALRYENESYDNVASLNLGARVLATKALKLDIEGLYKHYDNGLDYLGANLSVRLSF